MADRKKISKKTLAKAFHHWYYGHLTCFSQEHMQTFGYLTSMKYMTQKKNKRMLCKPIRLSSTLNHNLDLLL